MIKAIFRYPPEFTSLPEYTAHAGQTVTVLRALRATANKDGPAEYDPEYLENGLPADTMFEIGAADGWRGHAWESELEWLP